jgi:hypothetical protein
MYTNTPLGRIDEREVLRRKEHFGGKINSGVCSVNDHFDRGDDASSRLASTRVVTPSTGFFRTWDEQADENDLCIPRM